MINQDPVIFGLLSTIIGLVFLYQSIISSTAKTNISFCAHHGHVLRTAIVIKYI